MPDTSFWFVHCAIGAFRVDEATALRVRAFMHTLAGQPAQENQSITLVDLTGAEATLYAASIHAVYFTSPEIRAAERELDAAIASEKQEW